MNRTEIADMVLYMVSVEEAEKPETRARALEIADKIMSEIPEITEEWFEEIFTDNLDELVDAINKKIRG